VSARLPAVFLGNMKYPARYKMALHTLDQLVARTNPSLAVFYVIHIKEVRNIA
jgi:hypothetical protein